jgi:hypothetical protein
MPWYVAWAPTPSNGWLGEVYIGPNSKIAVGEKLQFSAAHRTVRWCIRQSGGAPDSPVVHRTTHCSLSGAPSRCSVKVGDRWRRRLFHTGQSGAHTGQSGGLLSECHLELAVGLEFPGAPDSPACGHRTVWCASHRQSAAAHLDSSWIFLMSSFEVLLSSIP